MKKKLYGGTTSHIERVFLQDTSQTDGRGLTGLAYNSAGLTVYYIRQGEASATAIGLVTATVGTWVSGGFVEIDATNMPGWYELHVPNAAIAAGAKSVGLHLKGATNMAPYPIELELDAVNYQSAADFGVTALIGHTPQTGDNYARIGAPAGASVSEDVAAVKVDTAAILADTGTDGVVVAAGSKSDYALSSAGVTAVQSGLATSANQTTILARLGAWTGSARNTILGAMQALFRSDADATVPSDINADLGSGGGDASNAHDSLEAIRDRGDAAWTTGGGASGANSVTITVRDSSTLAALVGVRVNIYGSDGTSLVDSDTTDSGGQVAFELDDGSYYYAVPAIAGYSSQSNTALTVDGTETATVNLVAIAATSVSAGTRVVRVIVVDGSGALKSGVVVTANLVKKGSSIANAFATNTQLSDTTDANGIADLTLITSDQFETGDGVYKIVAPGCGEWTEAIPAGSGAYVLQTAVV